MTFFTVKNLIQSDGHPTGSSFKVKKDKMNNEWIKAPQGEGRDGALNPRLLLISKVLKSKIKCVNSVNLIIIFCILFFLVLFQTVLKYNTVFIKNK